MKTPKELYPQAQEIYTCELEFCPACGEKLAICNYRNGRKTVQTMTSILKVGYRPKRCSNPCCIAYDSRFPSAQWRHLSPSHCTYGYDLIAHIGWQRQTGNQQFAALHTDLRIRGIQISEVHVRHLYHQRYLPLLACHERSRCDELQQVADERGLILSLDGLAPEGGEPQLWVVRDLLTGITLRSGWLSRQKQSTFEDFLRPIADSELSIKAIISDKQTGLLPAVATIFPETEHGLCHLHYLKNLADPVAEADQTMKVTLRSHVSLHVGELLRQEQVENPGILTVTGMLPTPIVEDEPALPNISVKQEREDIVTTLLRRVRYLLTLKGRSPFRLAGIEMVERLTEIIACLTELIAHYSDLRLVQLQQGLQKALRVVAKEYEKLQVVTNWLHHIADLLDPDGKDPRTGDEVRDELFSYLEELRQHTEGDGVMGSFVLDFYGLTSRYAVGLFHTYDILGLPRTNNDRESEFRDLRRRLLMTTGQQGVTRRWLQRSGAWELIPHPDSFAETVTALSGVGREEFCQERKRVRQHRSRFTTHTRSAKRSRWQLKQLQERWLDLPPRASPV
ncbi:MAG: hypothetical protein HN929_05630 [Chloroflexi bacterium]|jgi:hypothetical protein|nr:hypothetical protein [Chloroflexota bacterium]